MDRFTGTLVVATAEKENAILSCMDNRSPQCLLRDRAFKCNLGGRALKPLILFDRFYRQRADNKGSLFVETRLVHAPRGQIGFALTRRYDNSLRYPGTADINAAASNVVYLNERGEICEKAIGKPGTRQLFRNVTPANSQERGATYGPRYSPKGDRIAFLMFDDPGVPGLKVVRTENPVRSQIQNGPATQEAVWSPDGQHIAACCFREYDEARNHLLVFDPDLKNGYEIELPRLSRNGKISGTTAKNERRIRHLAWSSDGKKMAGVLTSERGESVWIVDVGSRAWTCASGTFGSCWNVRWSPQGDHLAFLASTQKRTSCLDSVSSWLHDSGNVALPSGDIFIGRIGQKEFSPLRGLPKSLEFLWI